MNWLDAVILVVLGIGGLGGWRMGIIRGVLIVVGVILGIVLAGRFGGELGATLDFVDNPNGARVLGFAIVFGLVVAAAAIASSILRRVIRLFFLGWVDGVGGVGLGMAAGSLVLTAVIAATGSFPFGGLGGSIGDSRLAPFLANNVPLVLDLLPEPYRDVLSYVPGDVDLPRASMEWITADASPTGAEVKLELSLDNPNPFGGTIQRAEYRVVWERGGQRVPLGEAGEERGERLRAGRKTLVDLQLEVEPAAARDLARQLALEGSARLTAEGRLTVAFRTETLDVSFVGTKSAQGSK